MKPKLYQYAACPFCSKVASLLHYKGVDYETVEVHPLNKKEIAFSADYRAVPIYVDSHGQQVNDSTPIMRHIDSEFPNPPVFRDAMAEKNKEEKWLTWSEQLVQGLPTVVYKDLKSSLKSFNYITKVGKFGLKDKLLIKFSGAFIMTMVAKKIRKRCGIEDPEKFLKNMTVEWTTGLDRRWFNGGDTPNAADVAVYGICRIVADLEAGRIFRENTVFSEWFARMSDTTRFPILKS